jgi:hypothetical protein
MKKVFQIVKFDLIGKVLYTSKERPDIEYRESNGVKRFYEAGTNTEAMNSHLWEYAITPKVNAVDSAERFMPYFADVIEDLPSWAKWEPKRFENCQLMVEKHGAFLQFWHEPTKQVLRIAMNSHYYEPVK